MEVLLVDVLEVLVVLLSLRLQRVGFGLAAWIHDFWNWNTLW
jgi:hypothetical protein